MIEPLILTTYLMTCALAIERYFDGRKRGRFDQQFFAGCMALFLVAFGLVRWV